MKPLTARASHTARLITRLAVPALMALMAGASSAQVGMAQLDVGDLPVTLVYPTAQAVQPVTRGPFELKVAIDAAPLPGARRLIVMSHGTGGNPLADHALAATLARAGFVVAQPTHLGDNHLDTSRAGEDSFKRRPGEAIRVIDALAQHPTWGPLLTLDKVGVHGMSAGGLTALSLAGAQWRMLDLVRHCLDHADADFGFCFAGAPTPKGQAERRANYERARGVPEDFFPAEYTAVHGGRTPVAGSASDVRIDPRVAAVTLAVPLSALFTPESLARISVPVGVVSASRDQFLLPKFHADHVLRECKACSRLADLTGAGHMDVLSPWPEALAREVALRQARGGMPEKDFDGAQREAAFQKIAAFFEQHLRP